MAMPNRHAGGAGWPCADRTILVAGCTGASGALADKQYREYRRYPCYGRLSCHADCAGRNLNTYFKGGSLILFSKAVASGPAPGFVLKAPSFDDALELINAGYVRHGMEHAGLTFWYSRRHYATAHWRFLTKGQLFEHPVRNIATTCPMTSRNYHKSRGYAGDAVTLDYI
jgi:hypothetical protein